jgi:hypothetical protein
MRAVVWLVAVGCGRIGFDPLADDAAPGTATYVQTVLADHPIAYYRLDETSGTVAHDSSGNGNDASYDICGGQLGLGMPGALAHDPDTAAGLSNNGGAGLGTTASVDVPPGAYVFRGDFTVEGWVEPATPAGPFNDAFFAAEDYNSDGFRAGWDNELSPLVWTNEDGVTQAPFSLETATTLVAARWSYLVFTRAGATWSVYVDGAVVATGGLGFNVPPTTATMFFASRDGIPSGTVFDELAIYPTALDATRIAAHYAAAQ